LIGVVAVKRTLSKEAANIIFICAMGLDKMFGFGAGLVAIFDFLGGGW